jgi:tight adherence protein B
VDPVVLLIGFAFAASTALTVVYVYERATFTQRLARARVIARQDRAGGEVSALRQERRSPLPLIDGLPLSAHARERMEWELDRAGLPMRVSEYLAIRIASASGGLILGILLGSRAGLVGSVAVVIGCALFLVGWLAPRWWVSRKRQQRLALIEKQLPDALTTLTKSLRAGTGLLQGLAYAAEETPAPLGPELQQALRDLHLGADPEEVFEELSDRVGSTDLDIAVTAIIIQRTIGGNLSEILGNVSTTIRERVRIQAEIRVLTARQRLTGWLMAAMPMLLALVFLSINPALVDLLVETTPGRISLLVGLGFEGLGLFLIRQFGRIDV